MQRERTLVSILMFVTVLLAMFIILVNRLAERVSIASWVLWAALLLLVLSGIAMLVMIWRVRRGEKP